MGLVDRGRLPRPLTSLFNLVARILSGFINGDWRVVQLKWVQRLVRRATT